MIYSPFIDFLANIPLATLVRPAEDQTVDGQTACFCPFCRQERVSRPNEIVKENKGGSERPHFIIYKDKFGGLYGGRGAQAWMCTRTGKRGYGALELWAAKKNMSLEGESLRRVAVSLLEKVGYTEDQIREQFPHEIPYVKDLRQEAERSVNQFLYIPRADFTPQELTALGCEVRAGGAGVQYSFGSDFSTALLNEDFRTYSVAEITLPAVQRRGKEVSERIYGTPFNPLFITFADKAETCGCIWRPATSMEPIVFSNNDEITISRVSRWLGGDKVFLFATEHRDSKTTAVVRAIKELEPDEDIQKTCDDFMPRLDKEGNETNKFDLVKVPIPNAEAKVRNVVFCDSPQDAIATYYTLRARRLSQPDNIQLQEQCWYHVAFMMGKSKFLYLEHGEWKQSSVEFGTKQHRKLARFADKTIILFPNSIKPQRTACAVARRFRDMSLALLPQTFRSSVHRRQNWIFGHEPSTVRDLILSYQMLDEEAFQYDRDFRKFFHTIINSALPSAPLVEQKKRDRNNAVRETYYTVDPSTVWVFMMCEGYFRSVDPESDDKIGQYIHRDGPFIEPLTKESMVAKTLDCLREYARINAKTPEEHRLMLSGIARAGKEVNLQTIVSLPSTILNYEGAYGPKVDHFFYQNGALKITPEEIRLVPYGDIEFDIDRRAVRPFSFRMPSQIPFVIKENPEAKAREEALDAKKNEKDENGVNRYTTRQLSQMRSKFIEWSRTFRWQVDWQGREEQDMWPALRVLRGFANVNWEMEEEHLRCGEAIPDVDKAILSARFANFLFACGVCCWRYHGSTTNCAPYLMENSVADNKKATGGSGKSTLANIFVSSARSVLSIDCKKMLSPNDMRFALSDYIPNVHAAVHWEDLPKSFSLKFIYNNITSGFQYEKKHTDAQRLKLIDSPAHIISSNYPLSDTDSSTLRRFVMVPFSDRFCGENPLQNKPARQISDLMPDFSQLGIEYFKNNSQCHMAYIMALAVQFVMRYGVIVNAPIEDVKHRQMVESLTDSFVRWAEYFFSMPSSYNIVIDLDSAWEEYKRDFTDSSKAKQDSFALSTFKNRCEEYCQFNGITMNPPHLFETKRAKEQKYFQLTTWVTVGYFTEKEWGNDPTIHPKFIRQSSRTEHGVIFYRPDDQIPSDYKSLKAQQAIAMNLPDPAPILDDDGTPITLTDDELQRWNNYLARKQGKRFQPKAEEVASTASEEEIPLPF